MKAVVPTSASGTMGSGLYGDGTITVVNDRGSSNSVQFSVQPPQP
jgi:hypothetical protein